MRLPDRVEVLNATSFTQDDRGGDVPDWASVTPLLEPAQVVPVDSVEMLQGRDRVTSRWRLLLLPQTRCTALSRIRWPVGSTTEYEVDGDIERHLDGRGRGHHCTALLVRITG